MSTKPHHLPLYKTGWALFANPAFTQIPSHGASHRLAATTNTKLTPAEMSGPLRNDGARLVFCTKDARKTRQPPGEISKQDRDYYLERKYPSYGNLRAEGTFHHAQRRRFATRVVAVGPGGRGVYLILPTRSNAWAKM